MYMVCVVHVVYVCACFHTCVHVSACTGDNTSRDNSANLEESEV